MPADETNKDKKISDLEAKVNSLTNQRDQLLRDIAAIYGYQKQINVSTPANPYTTVENNTTSNSAKTEVTPSTKSTSTTTSNTVVVSSNESLEEALARAKKLELDLAEMTKQRDKLQKDLDTHMNNVYNSKRNPLSPTTETTPTKSETTSTTTVTTTTNVDSTKTAATSKDTAATGTDTTKSTDAVKTTETTKDAKVADTKSTDPAKTTETIKDAKVADAKSTDETKTTTTTTTEVTTVTSIEEAQNRIKQLEEELGILSKERDQLKQDLHKSKADKALDNKIAELNAKIDQIEQDKTLTEEEKIVKIKEANDKIAKINEEKKNIEISIENNSKRIDEKNASLDEIKKEYESKILTLTKEINELKEDKETLETDLASSKEQIEEDSAKHKEEVERLTLQAQKLEDALEKEIKKGGKSNSISNGGTLISTKGGKTVISLASRVNFKSGSKELTAEGKRTLDKIINVLRKHSSERIQVEGNTDDKPLADGSKFKDNWHLSFERALTVLKYLNKGQLGKTQFAAAGLGEKNPIKPNTTEANRAANRRVDIVVMPKR